MSTLIDFTTAERIRVANADAQAVRVGNDIVWTRPTLYTPWVERRRNYMRSPRGVNLGGWAGTLGTLTAIPDAGGVEWVRTGTGAARVFEMRHGTTVPAGSILAIKGEYRSTNTLTLTWRADTAQSGSASAAVAINTWGVAADWTPFETITTVPVPTPTANAGFVFTATTGAAGATSAARNIQFEIAPLPLGPFFDGDTADTELNQFRWFSTPYNSPSIFEDRTVRP